MICRERVYVETGALREKPFGGEKRINKLKPYMTPSKTVLSQVNWD